MGYLVVFEEIAILSNDFSSFQLRDPTGIKGFVPTRQNKRIVGRNSSLPMNPQTGGKLSAVDTRNRRFRGWRCLAAR